MRAGISGLFIIILVSCGEQAGVADYQRRFVSSDNLSREQEECRNSMKAFYLCDKMELTALIDRKTEGPECPDDLELIKQLKSMRLQADTVSPAAWKSFRQKVMNLLFPCSNESKI
jgi:hypothetical protein